MSFLVSIRELAVTMTPDEIVEYLVDVKGWARPHAVDAVREELLEPERDVKVFRGPGSSLVFENFPDLAAELIEERPPPLAPHARQSQSRDWRSRSHSVRSSCCSSKPGSAGAGRTLLKLSVTSGRSTPNPIARAAARRVRRGG